MQTFDFTTEQPISIAKACDWMPRRPNGKKVSIRTVVRWMMHGHNGVFLEGGKLGESYCTSVEALQRFSQRLIGGAGAELKRTPQQARKSNEDAKKELARLGISGRGMVKRSTRQQH